MKSAVNYPNSFAGKFFDSLKRRLGNNDEADALCDLVRLASYRAQKRSAGRAWPLHLGTEHHVVRDQRVVAAEQFRLADCPVFSLEYIVLRDPTAK